MNFTGLITTTNLPSQVQTVFSLRDQEGHAIVRPAEEVERGVKVYERGPGTGGDWEEIDYTETSFSVSTAENIDLEIVFVLDFTNSMSEARLGDGRNGIEAMLDAFEAGLAVLPSAHRVGVVEFHDRNVRPSVLSPLTTDRQAVLNATRAFLARGFDPGSSRVWDSLVVAAGLFSDPSQNPRAVRALVFLSDGRDTSSKFTREQAADAADFRGVQLYAVGVGEVFQAGELRSIARSTGGAYYSARDLNLIQEQIQLLVNDLRGQYQLTYITLRRTGEYHTAVSVELAGIEGDTVFGPFDVARFFGPDNQGVIEFDPPTLDRANRRATAFMRALHVPRNIDRIRFRVETPKPLQVELVPGRDGGLLAGWSLTGPDAGGWYEASSGTPLEFGSLGLLAKLTFSNVTEDGLGIPIEFDNSIYTGGKTLARSTYLYIGTPPPVRILFTSNRDDPDPDDDDDIENIYVMNADGSGLSQLTDNSADDFLPSWSPDGRRIAFTSNRDRGWEIYVMNADGSGRTRLTDNSASNFSPSWSPDGRRIAFYSYRDGNSEIYVMNADGSGQTRLTDNEARDSSPRWSPDGRRIAFSSNRDDPDPDDDNYIRSIYVMNTDGSGQTRLTDTGIDYSFFPRWSPDGRRIAFVAWSDRSYEIYVANADGSGQTRMTENEVWDTAPIWSPDGRRIAFYSNRDGNNEIYVMNTDGSGQTRLTNNEAGDYDPSWSPDGRRIVFNSNRDDPDPDDDNYIRSIYVMNADGSGVTRLTKTGRNRSPLWSPAPK